MQINTLYQVMAMKFAAAPALKIARSLLLMPDLFNYLLCGRRSAEYTIASTSQMSDPRTRSWSAPLLASLGIDASLLQRIVEPGTTLGELRGEVCEECGVEPAAVIAPGCHDTASAVAAVPAGGDDFCYISSGTWSLMGVELAGPLINEKSLRLNYTNEGGVCGTTRFLKNIMGMWLLQECRRQWKSEGYDHTYDELTGMAERAAAFGAMVNPAHPPFLTPGDMTGKIAEYCRQTSQTPPTSRGEFARACLESLALTYRLTLDGLEEVLGRPIRQIHIVGGGSRNALLNQMTADCCGRPVVAGPVEATALGNILVQAMAAGEVKDLPHLRRIVRENFDVRRFEPRNPSAWDEPYRRYRRMVGD